MKKLDTMRWPALGAIAVALSACASTPMPNATLDGARDTVRQARANANAVAAAPNEVQRAEQYLTMAEEAWRDNEQRDVQHYSYLGRTHALVALETGERRAAEQRLSDMAAERQQAVLDARARQASEAEQRALQAQFEAAQQAQMAQQQAQMAQQEKLRAQNAQVALLQQQQAAQAAEQRAEQASQRVDELQQQLKDMAVQTNRGLSVTFGDVLFDTDRAELRSGARRSIERLAEALRSNPQRRVVIEGFTDSQGADSYNMDLSQRRAQAVRDALVAAGAPAESISVRGYGEAFPVATNDTSAGRQQNRRVEVVISNTNNNQIAPRAQN